MPLNFTHPEMLNYAKFQAALEKHK